MKNIFLPKKWKFLEFAAYNGLMSEEMKRGYERRNIWSQIERSEKGLL